MTRLAVLAALLATAIAAALVWHAKHNPPEPVRRGWREPYDRDEPVALFV